jgi:hypothetical protein
LQNFSLGSVITYSELNVDKPRYRPE